MCHGLQEKLHLHSAVHPLDVTQILLRDAQFAVYLPCQAVKAGMPGTFATHTSPHWTSYFVCLSKGPVGPYITDSSDTRNTTAE